MKNTLTDSPCQSPAPARIFTPDDYREFIAAASMAVPIGGNDSQAFGGATIWNQNVRPGRCEARRKSLLMILRASELALAERPELEIRHVIAAIRSHALNPADLLVCPRTGKWLSSKKHVTHRGLELSGSIAELALVILQVENETASKAQEKGAA